MSNLKERWPLKWLFLKWNRMPTTVEEALSGLKKNQNRNKDCDKSAYPKENSLLQGTNWLSEQNSPDNLIVLSTLVFLLFRFNAVDDHVSWPCFRRTVQTRETFQILSNNLIWTFPCKQVSHFLRYLLPFCNIYLVFVNTFIAYLWFRIQKANNLQFIVHILGD